VNLCCKCRMYPDTALCTHAALQVAQSKGVAKLGPGPHMVADFNTEISVKTDATKGPSYDPLNHLTWAGRTQLAVNVTWVDPSKVPWASVQFMLSTKVRAPAGAHVLPGKFSALRIHGDVPMYDSTLAVIHPVCIQCQRPPSEAACRIAMTRQLATLAVHSRTLRKRFRSYGR
jgi:hypothetical protein